jgi:hypothetical protein
LVLVPKPFSWTVSKIQHSWKSLHRSDNHWACYLSVYVGERDTQTQTQRRVGMVGGHMFLVQNFDGQFGVGGILELGFEEPRWGLTVCAEEINWLFFCSESTLQCFHHWWRCFGIWGLVWYCDLTLQCRCWCRTCLGLVVFFMGLGFSTWDENMLRRGHENQ